MTTSPLIEQLIKSLRCLPGVGPKSAQRMAYHCLERASEPAKHLAHTLLDAIDRIGHCNLCNTLTELERCLICTDLKRDPTQLCVVETPADQLAIEQTHTFRGYYYILMGHLSPLDGIGPEELKLDKFVKRLEARTFEEVILATNSTIEGETTAHFLAEMIKPLNIKTSRIAHGVPVGGELEMIDSGTLIHAFAGREEMV